MYMSVADQYYFGGILVAGVMLFFVVAFIKAKIDEKLTEQFYTGWRQGYNQRIKDELYGKTEEHSN